MLCAKELQLTRNRVARGAIVAESLLGAVLSGESRAAADASNELDQVVVTANKLNSQKVLDILRCAADRAPAHDWVDADADVLVG
jgi:hypothetical protein